MYSIIISFLLTSVIDAKVVRRNGSTLSPTVTTTLTSISLPGVPIPLSTSQGLEDITTTITVPLPSPAASTATTVAACTKANGEIVPAIVIVGIPIDTFSPGVTKTIPVVPQAEPTTITYYDTPPGNGTEVIVVEPLPGVCGTLVAPDLTTASNEPTSTPTACPSKGCTGLISRAAETIIDAINEVTQLSLILQFPARKIGEPVSGLPPRPSLAARDEADASLLPSNPILEVSNGLGRITLTISLAFPTFQSFPPLPPDCSADTIVLAWLEFVRVHQELLSILIGRSGLLERGPTKRSDVGMVAGRGELVTRATQGFVGKPIAAALRKLEGVVDTLAVTLVDVVPNKSECTKQKSGELKKSIQKAETSYDG